jgi:uncharacterized protein (TIGR03067 family)
MEGHGMSVLGIVISAYLLASPAPKGDDAAKSERAKWQGTWRIAAMEITTGERTSRLVFSDSEMTWVRVNDDLLEISGLNFPYSAGKLTLDPTKDPKRLTLRLIDKSKKGPTIEGTYARDGDDLRLELPKWPRDKDETVKLRLDLKRVKE